jgi:serine/threonine protein kinase
MHDQDDQNWAQHVHHPHQPRPTQTLRPRGGPKAGLQVTIEHAQQLVSNCLSGMGQLAKELCCILTQADVNSPALNSVGFAKVVTKGVGLDLSADFWSEPNQPETKALLITQVGFGIDPKTSEVLASLSGNAAVPCILVVIIAQVDQILREAGSRVAFCDMQHKIHEALISEGADDVLLVDTQERLSEHRVLEAVHRIEILARRLSMEIDIIQRQATKKVEEVKEMASKKLQVAWKTQMWMLPGSVLESIPSEDPSIHARAATDCGGLGGVGDYNFEARLGGGSFGTVFKAQHADYGTIAVKVIQKSSVKNVSQLFSLNQELGIMQHVPTHANVTAAHVAFHTSDCIYLVMEFSGGRDLHKFVRATLSSEGIRVLPRDLARSFCVQQAIAVSHLHNMMVSHRDLKPANFIVSDTGNILRLVDFGFAVMLCGKEQRLSACCGSLPFCAPEVLRAGSTARGYDPFAADMWSLALNFVELACGPHCIEKCLGWVPHNPVEVEQRKRDLDRLEALWASTPDTGIEGLGRTVSSMLVLDPAKRWNIVQVLGQEGFGAGLTPSPPGRRGRAVKVRKEFAPVNNVGSPALFNLESESRSAT